MSLFGIVYKSNPTNVQDLVPIKKPTQISGDAHANRSTKIRI